MNSLAVKAKVGSVTFDLMKLWPFPRKQELLPQNRHTPPSLWNQEMHGPADCHGWVNIIQRHNFSCLTCIRVLHCILRWRQSKMAAASRSKCMPGRLRAESRDSFRRPSTLRSRRRGATERLPVEREKRISGWSLSIDFVCSRLKKCSTNRRTESRPNEKHRLRPNDNDEMPQDNWCHLNRNNNNNSTHFNIILLYAQ